MRYLFFFAFLSLCYACQSNQQRENEEDATNAKSLPRPNFDIGKPYQKAGERPKRKPRVLSQDTTTYYTDFDIYQMKPIGKALKGEVNERCVAYTIKGDSIILEIYPTGNVGNVQERLYTKEKQHWKCIYEISDNGWISQVVEFIDNKQVLNFNYDMDYPYSPRLTAVRELRNEANRFARTSFDMKKRENLAPKYYEDVVEALSWRYNTTIHRDYEKVERSSDGSAKIHGTYAEKIIKNYAHFWDIYLRLWRI